MAMVTELSTKWEEAAVTVRAVSPAYVVYREVAGDAVEAYCCDTKEELDVLVQQLETRKGEVRVHTNTGEKTIVLPSRQHPELAWYAIGIAVLLMILFALHGC